MINDREKRLMRDNEPKYIRVYDNNGKTIDRYTVVFTGRYTNKTGGMYWYLGMSDSPTSPSGVGNYGESANQVDKPTYSHLGKKVRYTVLPDACKRLVEYTYRDLWDLPATSK